MRKLMWFTIGFTGACIVGVYLISGIWLAVITAICAALGIGLCFYKKKLGVIVLIGALGFGIGAGWLQLHDAVYLTAARNVDGKTLTTEIEATDYSWKTDYGTAVNGRVEVDGRRFQVCVYMDEMTIRPGDVLKGEFRFRFTAAGGKQDATYHPGKGVFLLAYGDDSISVKRQETIPLRFFPAKLRKNIQDTIDTAFPEDTVGFARALLLGDSTRLSDQDDTAFKISGIRHVIAVSGLHVSILFSLIYVFVGKRRIITAVLGIPILILFAAVAGFTPSIMRACIMQCLMILGLLLKKEYDSPTSLSFAVLVMLVANPLSITSVSFQLSVGCMTGIFLFSGKINRFLLRILRVPKDKSVRAKLGRWLAGCVAVTVSATAVTMPLSAYYFGTVSIVGILTNLLTLWAISFVFYGIMLACLLGVIWMPLSTAIAWIISWPIRYVLLVARSLSAIPCAAVYTSSVYIVLWIVFCYVILCVFLLQKQKHPFVYLAGIVISLCIAVTASHMEAKTENFQVTVLDVGQGQAILIQSQDKTYLVDCGSDSKKDAADITSQFLLSKGINRLDGLILTHYDEDHAGDVENLLYRVQTDVLFLPDSADDGDIKARLIKAFSEDICWVSEITTRSGKWGSFTIYPGADNKDDNESGLGILFQAEECDILITGDWSSAQELRFVQTTDLPELELLVLGHHGSKSATSFPLLSATKPKTAVVSVAKNNGYGHPAPEVLRRLEMFDCKVWRTDLDGTITFGR